MLFNTQTNETITLFPNLNEGQIFGSFSPDCSKISYVKGGTLWVADFPYKNAFSIDTLNTDNNFHPEEFSLLQNYPDPFNPTTSISFNLPKEQYVILTVYNSVGMEFTTLVDKQMSAGRHSIEWNAA